MSKAIIEILSDINANPDEIKKYKESMLLKLFFEYAFDPELKFVLPEGIPPYTPDTCPLGTNPTNFNNEIRRLYIFTKKKELDSLRREALFIQLLETIHESEAKLLLAVKDQNITRLFPNVTLKLVIENGFLSSDLLPVEIPEKVNRKNHEITINEDVKPDNVIGVKTEVEPEVKPKKRGRPRKNQS